MFVARTLFDLTFIRLYVVVPDWMMLTSH